MTNKTQTNMKEALGDASKKAIELLIASALISLFPSNILVGTASVAIASFCFRHNPVYAKNLIGDLK